MEWLFDHIWPFIYGWEFFANSVDCLRNVLGFQQHLVTGFKKRGFTVRINFFTLNLPASLSFSYTREIFTSTGVSSRSTPATHLSQNLSGLILKWSSIGVMSVLTCRVSLYILSIKGTYGAHPLWLCEVKVLIKRANSRFLRSTGFAQGCLIDVKITLIPSSSSVLVQRCALNYGPLSESIADGFPTFGMSSLINLRMIVLVLAFFMGF